MTSVRDDYLLAAKYPHVITYLIR